MAFVGIEPEDDSTTMNRATITIGHTPVEVPFYRTNRPPLFAGLRQHWMDGEAEGVTFNVGCGAGLGSGYMTLTVERPGMETVYEYVDMSAVIKDRVTAILEDDASG